MAFMGIFIVMWLLIIILIIIGCMILLVFIPSLVLSIVNLVQGIKRHWPKRNIVMLSIFGTITFIFVGLFLGYLVYRLGYYVPPETEQSYSSEMSNLLFYLSSL